MDTIGKINAVLKERGMNGAELSRIIGVSSAVYSQWNRRVTKPSNKNLVKIASALNIDVAYLASDEEIVGAPELTSAQQNAWNIIREMDDETLQRFIKIAKIALEK